MDGNYLEKKEKENSGNMKTGSGSKHVQKMKTNVTGVDNNGVPFKLW